MNFVDIINLPSNTESEVVTTYAIFFAYFSNMYDPYNILSQNNIELSSVNSVIMEL